MSSNHDPQTSLSETNERLVGLRLKRLMDLAIGAAALILLSPALVLIAIVIRLNSPGPALFRQTRIGWKERPFEMWKFRTMIHDAPDDLHKAYVAPLVRGGAVGDVGSEERSGTPIYKLPADPRITRLGGWLRRTSLDELPQLLNVLRGEMSLVGPRPIVTYEYDAYEEWQFERFRMPQGMTGLWQVSGRSNLSYRRMCELDIEYVHRWSLWLDLKILAKTPCAVVAHRETPTSAPGEREGVPSHGARADQPPAVTRD